jgi:hypothetical protein
MEQLWSTTLPGAKRRIELVVLHKSIRIRGRMVAPRCHSRNDGAMKSSKCTVLQLYYWTASVPKAEFKSICAGEIALEDSLLLIYSWQSFPGFAIPQQYILVQSDLKSSGNAAFRRSMRPGSPLYRDLSLRYGSWSKLTTRDGRVEQILVEVQK